MNKKGVTVAELLIAMVVLGLVAIAAIPIFVATKQDKETTAKLQLAQSILSNATEMSEIHYGKLNDEQLETRTSNDIFVDFYKNNLKLNYVCKEDSSEKCWAPTKDFFEKSKAAGGDKYGIVGTVHTGFTLQDGINVTMTKVEGVDEKFGIETKDKYSVIFMVDVNGNQEPNAIGKDVFAFILDSRGRIVPAGKDNDSANCKQGCDLDDDYWDCSAKVIVEGKRSYIK